MRTIGFFKIDFARCRLQYVYLIVIGCVSLYLAMLRETAALSLLYMIFGTIVLSTVPFSLDQTSESGFINMLPGTTKQRVAGRFLFSLGLLVLSIVIGGIDVLLIYLMKGTIIPYQLAIFMGGAGLGLLVSALQNILFYSLGKVRSVQVMGIIRMIPGFVLFFGITLYLESLGNNLEAALKTVLENANIIGLGLLVLGVVVFLLAIPISTAIIKNRDYA